MKSLLFFLLVPIVISTCNKGFNILPECWIRDLYSKFIPAYKIDYWEYRNYTPIDSITEIHFKAGDFPPQIVIPNYEISSSFRNACHHVACYDYIVYIRNNKIELINDLSDLLLFIGDIDNLEEGLFLRHILAPEYYSISPDGNEIGSYLLGKAEITFVLLKDEIEYDRIGQYELSINRLNHSIHVKRLRTYSTKI